MHPETNLSSVLEWLAQANLRHLPEYTDDLHRQIQLIRAAPISTPQRTKFLDLFFTLTESLVLAEIPALHQTTLPISRRLRQKVRSLQDLLETLSQDFLNTLSELFDPESPKPHRTPEETLRKTLQCISWNIRISHLVAAPTPPGLWQNLHSTLNTSQRLGLLEPQRAHNKDNLEHLYLSSLLTAIAQPASFNSHELEFITECIHALQHHVHLTQSPPGESNGVFWIDPNADFPAHALIRRHPPPETIVWFFSCRKLAEIINAHLKVLGKGVKAATLNLPDLADQPSGQSVLHRLVSLWGSPGKRRFTRRRQSYRAKLSIGLEQLWHLMKTPDAPQITSEWIVTNESPDGFSIMHVSGETGCLQVGDVIALQLMKSSTVPPKAWHICIVRWAISENPEHIELGLELIASRAMAAEIAQPLKPAAGTMTALLIPENPPLRNSPAILIGSGQLNSLSGKLIVVLEKENLEIREVRPTRLDEHTHKIDIFSVEPDGTT